MSEHDRLVSSLKAAAWERAKGELRAVAALEGSRYDGPREDDGRHKYQHIYDAIDDFVKDFEDRSLHE